MIVAKTYKDFRKLTLSCITLFLFGAVTLNGQRKRAEFEVDANSDHRTVVKAGNMITWIALDAMGHEFVPAHGLNIFWLGKVDYPPDPLANPCVSPGSLATGTCKIVPMPTTGVYMYQFCPDFSPACVGKKMSGKIRIKDPSKPNEIPIDSDQTIALLATGEIRPAVHIGDILHLRTTGQKDLSVTFTSFLSGTSGASAQSPCAEDFAGQPNHKGPCFVYATGNADVAGNKNYSFDCTNKPQCTDPVIHVLDANDPFVALNAELEAEKEKFDSTYAKSNADFKLAEKNLKKAASHDLTVAVREFIEEKKKRE